MAASQGLGLRVSNAMMSWLAGSRNATSGTMRSGPRCRPRSSRGATSSPLKMFHAASIVPARKITPVRITSNTVNAQPIKAGSRGP